MGFTLPKYITEYLDNTWRKPPQNFMNSSMFYAGLNTFFMNYMNNVVRPCVAYSSGSADGITNSGAKFNAGLAIKRAAVRLIKGDKILFEGDDKASKALSDIWSPHVNFENFLESGIDFLMDGTTLFKLNRNRSGNIYPCANRVDRFYSETDENGDVISVTMFNSFLFNEDFGRDTTNQYWLVEERYYNKNGSPVCVNKVHVKSGVAGHELLPTIGDVGIAFKALPPSVQQTIKRRGIILNKEIILPFSDGLGVWQARRTANNSVVPGLAMGDPLLYGALDILWAIDVVFTGSITDVILGRGKILVPKRYLDTIREDFAKLGVKTDVAVFNSDLQNDDDTLVYVITERDKDFDPKSVQFDIRAEQYRGMLEIYLRQAAVLCGFAPTSIFPFLQDQSAKTATEVTAEENLTRATIQSAHQTIEPIINKMLAEVLRLYGFKGKARIKLSDYIGNKILRDQNIRDNYLAGLVPKDVAVQRINDISAGETQEYLNKINEERQAEQEFTESQFANYLSEAQNDNSQSTAEFTSDSFGRGGN